MKFLDFFAGIGGFRRGMELAGHECVGFCEYDKYAVASYTAIHLLTDTQRDYIQSIPAPLKKNGERNLRKRQQEIWKEEYRNGEWYADDIRNVDAASLPKADCWCFGFPCQDISIAGNCLGFAGKRSSLFFAVTAIIRDLEEKDRPSYLLIENVKNLLSVNRGIDFAKLLIELDEVGYDAEWDVLNSKNFGVPQNRERVYIVGHLRGRRTRKVFPLGEADGVHNSAEEDAEIHEIAQCLTAGGNDKWNGDYIVKQIGNCMPTATRENPNQGRIYDPEGIAPCLSKMDGGGREPMIPVSITQKSCKEAEISPTLTASGTSKGRGNNSPVPGVMIWGGLQEHQTPRCDGISPTLTSAMGMGGGQIPLIKPVSAKESGGAMIRETATVRADGVYTKVSEDYKRPPLKGLSRCLKSETHDAGVFDGLRIRRLTPRECFRLQGWTDEYFDRAAMVNSDSQLYKQAGNGVTVNVIQAIFERMEIIS